MLYTFLLILSFAACGIYFVLGQRRNRLSTIGKQNCVVHENHAQFEYPVFQPDDTFDIDKTPPLPYRPFKWGPKYFVTMGIRNMDFENWIELDSRFRNYHGIRSMRVNQRGEDAVRILPASPQVPSGHPGAQELVHELSEYLSRRFPQVYRVTRKATGEQGFGWYQDGEIETIEVLPIGVTYNLREENPMRIASMLIQDDLAIMVEGADGRYYFQAGAICTPGFWRLKDKIGLPLEEIHLTGNVPQFKEKLQSSLARFFSKLPVDKPVLRYNFFFQVVRDKHDERRINAVDPDEMGWSESTNGSEDSWDHSNQRADPPLPATTASNIHLRMERQSLRRLPRSGAIVFTIRTYLEPIVEISKEPGVPGRLADAVRSMGDDILKYKGSQLWYDALLPYLDEQHAMQVQNGVVDENDRTNNYPY